MQGTSTTMPSTVSVHTVLLGDGTTVGTVRVGSGRPDGAGLLEAAGLLGFGLAELWGGELAGGVLLGAG